MNATMLLPCIQDLFILSLPFQRCFPPSDKISRSVKVNSSTLSFLFITSILSIKHSMLKRHTFNRTTNVYSSSHNLTLKWSHNPFNSGDNLIEDLKAMLSPHERIACFQFPSSSFSIPLDNCNNDVSQSKAFCYINNVLWILMLNVFFLFPVNVSIEGHEPLATLKSVANPRAPQFWWSSSGAMIFLDFALMYFMQYSI